MDQFQKLIDKYPQLEYSYGCAENCENIKKFIRPSFDEMYMAIAQIVSLRSTCLRGKIGAVITKDTRVISIGYNGAPQNLGQCDEFGCIKDIERGGCIRTIHAEQNAIAFASKNGIPLDGATIYITMSPCIDCAKLIIASGIKKIIYNEEYRKGYALDYLDVSGIEILRLEMDFNKFMQKHS